jgi:hypothetical protein
MSHTYDVSTGVDETAAIIESAVVSGSFTGECIDRHLLETPSGKCMVMVFEKHYYRVSNRLTLTVVIDDFNKRTRVHYVGGGGGQSMLFRFDWGAADSFSGVVDQALGPYMIE